MIYELTAHPDTPPRAVKRVRVQILNSARDDFVLEYLVEPVAALALPSMKSAGRADNLWETTCFELFVKPEGGEAYCEFNLSPSFEWAAYAFDGYRTGMRNLSLRHDPEIDVTPIGYFLCAELDLTSVSGGDIRLGPCAVIEEQDGTKSYWALRHPPGQPDFHHPDCFALELPAPDAA